MWRVFDVGTLYLLTSLVCYTQCDMALTNEHADALTHSCPEFQDGVSD